MSTLSVKEMLKAIGDKQQDGYILTLLEFRLLKKILEEDVAREVQALENK